MLRKAETRNTKGGWNNISLHKSDARRSAEFHRARPLARRRAFGRQGSKRAGKPVSALICCLPGGGLSAGDIEASRAGPPLGLKTGRGRLAVGGPWGGPLAGEAPEMLRGLGMRPCGSWSKSGPDARRSPNEKRTYSLTTLVTKRFRQPWRSEDPLVLYASRAVSHDALAAEPVGVLIDGHVVRLIMLRSV
jgi:hypothetical protein